MYFGAFIDSDSAKQLGDYLYVRRQKGEVKVDGRKKRSGSKRYAGRGKRNNRR